MASAQTLKSYASFLNKSVIKDRLASTRISAGPDLMECGSEKGVKDKGKFRMEGKDYIVKDGDILSIRFNV